MTAYRIKTRAEEVERDAVAVLQAWLDAATSFPREVRHNAREVERQTVALLLRYGRAKTHPFEPFFAGAERCHDCNESRDHENHTEAK